VLKLNSVLSKALRVLGYTEFFEPVGNILHRRPADDRSSRFLAQSLPALANRL
jgi:hypothetical protein